MRIYEQVVAKIPTQQDRIRDLELGVLMIDGWDSREFFFDLIPILWFQASKIHLKTTGCGRKEESYGPVKKFVF